MNELLEIIQGKISAGIYELSDEISVGELSKLCQSYEGKLFDFDGGTVFDKRDFFRVAREVINLPDYFGDNWDAWQDCLTDLSWCEAPSYLFVYRKSANFAATSPQDWAICLDIFSTAIAYWSAQNVSFSVVFLPS